MAVVVIFLCGLAAAQIVAFGQVWFSNQTLNTSLLALKAAGYFIVPNEWVEPALTSVGAAIYGGIFFTLSIGAGLTLLSFTFTYYWVHGAGGGAISGKKNKNSVSEDSGDPQPLNRFRRNTIFIPVAGAIFWGVILFKLNHSAISFFVSLYFFVVPLVVIPMTYRWAVKRKNALSAKIIAISLAPIILLTLIWSTQWDETLFVRVRDNLLLETRAGRAVNDFYYRYTLYPAEAFKPLSQKMLKSVYLAGVKNRQAAIEIEKKLRINDYLVIADSDAAALIITAKDSDLVFQPRGGSQRQISVNQFLKSPRKTLEDVSEHSDADVFFRLTVFYSLLFGFPVILYLFLFGLSQWLFSKIVSFRNATIATALLCFLVGLALFWPVRQSTPPDEVLNAPQTALTSERWQTRVAALQVIDDQGLRILDFLPYEKSMESVHISERYWLARALAGGRSAKTYKDLLQLLRDPHPNVQCQALYGLGRRKQRSALRPIYNAVKSSRHWYTQWYGYKALRSLQWVQPKSVQRPF